MCGISSSSYNIICILVYSNKWIVSRNLSGRNPSGGLDHHYEISKPSRKIVQRHVGQALYAAQCGEEYPTVKALKGFGGRSVLESVVDTWRAIYTARFADTIYVLHAFQKKSKKGIATPQKEIELIRQRLAAAERNHREREN
jgi:phage-related protein